MPVFVAKHNELKLQEQGQEADCQNVDMLGTIRLPQNLRMLKSNLPGSNYESDRPVYPAEDSGLAEIPEESPMFADDKMKKHPNDPSSSRLESANHSAAAHPGGVRGSAFRRQHRAPKVRQDVFHSNQ